MRRCLLTGGCGFIGSNLVRHLLAESPWHVVNFDALTYAGNVASLADVEGHPQYQFCQGNLRDAAAVGQVIKDCQPEVIFHLAAESHVDRSIEGPAAFVQTNVLGTFHLLQAALAHWRSLGAAEQARFRFIHVSTDEVFGSLGDVDPAFHEASRYDPRSPYAASKAASDHLARAWHHTYGLPVIVTHCSNNYGPYQFPEKLIPVVILRCLRREPIPVYGQGHNIRDWLYVEDHCRALRRIASEGQPGETYPIGGNNERRNLELVREICALVDELAPKLGLIAEPAVPAESLINFVPDRPGHDYRYAINSAKLRRELGWEPREDAHSGLRKTVQWYLENRAWWERLLPQSSMRCR